MGTGAYVPSEILLLFRYPAISGAALLNDVLPLRHCSTMFAWVLPSNGHAVDSTTVCGEDVGLLHVASYADKNPAHRVHVRSSVIQPNPLFRKRRGEARKRRLLQRNLRALANMRSPTPSNSVHVVTF